MHEVLILLVEDNISDIELIREALIENGAPHELEVMQNGQEALRRLLSDDLDRPHLIILDLNMPGVSGFDVLRIIKKDPNLLTIPTLILTNSISQDDVAKCYAHHCNAYIRKPVGYDRLIETIRTTWAFWVDRAVLPGRGARASMVSIPLLPTFPPKPR